MILLGYPHHLSPRLPDQRINPAITPACQDLQAREVTQ